MDVSASFQFLADALADRWHLLAPDWRGFGLSDWSAHGYEFHDHVADLDALIERLSPDEPARLVAHSMGGNVAMTYAGLRPQRVARLASLEGFGGHRYEPDRAPEHLARWLEQQRRPARLRTYPSLEAVAARLCENNPRLDAAHAQFLAGHWARPSGQGGWVLRADPRHRELHAHQTRIDEVFACWRRITCPVLWLMGDIPAKQGFRQDTPEQFAERQAQVPGLRLETVAGSGHMLHHDQPIEVAHRVDAFMREAAWRPARRPAPAAVRGTPPARIA
jgi:pimeloyl-ACP methyl ester carboxylesterase